MPNLTEATDQQMAEFYSSVNGAIVGLLRDVSRHFQTTPALVASLILPRVLRAMVPAMEGGEPEMRKTMSDAITIAYRDMPGAPPGVMVQ